MPYDPVSSAERGFSRYVSGAVGGTLHFYVISLFLQWALTDGGVTVAVLGAILAGETIGEALQKMKYWSSAYLLGWLAGLYFIGSKLETDYVYWILIGIGLSILLHRAGKKVGLTL